MTIHAIEKVRGNSGRWGHCDFILGNGRDSSSARRDESVELEDGPEYTLTQTEVVVVGGIIRGEIFMQTKISSHADSEAAPHPETRVSVFTEFMVSDEKKSKDGVDVWECQMG